MGRAFALVLIMIALGLLNIALLEHAAPNDGLPLVKADFSVCMAVYPPPLGPRPTAKSFYPRRNDNA